MVKKQPKRPRLTSQQLKSAAERLGSFLKVAVSSHPAVVGFLIMTGAAAVQAATYEGDHSRRKEVFNQAGNLYLGVQGTIIALAAAPVIAQGIGLATTAMRQSTSKSEVPVPP